MNLLLDANISWRLCKPLSGYFNHVLHVDDTELIKPAKDMDIWQYARKNEYTILTYDLDFQNLLMLNGFPPKVIVIKAGNLKSKNLEDLIINHIDDIQKFFYSELGILELVQIS